MTVDRGRRRVPLAPEEEEDEDESMTTSLTPGQMGSTDPAHMALAATDAAWRAYRASLIDRGALAGRWSNVAEAMAHAADVTLQTQDRYEVKMDAGTPDDLTAVVGDEPPEDFEHWARRQIDKLAAIVRDLEAERNGVAKHAGERVDPLGIGTQIHAAAERFAIGDVDADNHTGRLLWCLVELWSTAVGGDAAVIPQELWDRSGGGQVTVTMRADGGKLIRRS